jgi:malate dehydrogenase (oxaloacetate-decarboxylating)(NADP+)
VSSTDEEALDYHSGPPKPGKLEIRATKPMSTQLDLSLAYSPGVAAPCRVIAQDARRSYDFTNRGNLVAVITNGTAVLGLGDIGPEAAKPVMEGKAVLFKRFADIDVFDLELRGGPETVIEVVRALEPTFGGINLEDIKAPDAFYIEEKLRETMSIPVFHDDQHGTAIIAGAAFLNAVEIAGKRIEDIRLTVSGAGAAAIAVTNLLIELGLRREHILMADREGVLRPGRDLGDPYRAQFARETDCVTLADALVGADAFLGLSVGKGIVTGDMIRPMAPSAPSSSRWPTPTPRSPGPTPPPPAPTPSWPRAAATTPTRSTTSWASPSSSAAPSTSAPPPSTEEMKLAAVHALAALAREEVPRGGRPRLRRRREFRFGPGYIIPTPFDPRALLWVAPAVARAAMASGVAQRPIEDWDAYRVRLERMMDPGRGLLRELMHKAKRDPKRIVLSEGTDHRVVKAAAVLHREGIAKPILLGREDEVRAAAAEADVDLTGIEVVYPRTDPRFARYTELYLEQNRRHGATPARAREDVGHRASFAMMMVREGDADGAVMGATRPYAEAVRPALQIIGTRGRACGLHMVLTRDRTLFLADTTMNIEPDVDALVDMTIEVVAHVRSFDIEPRVAMLSFANFGAVRHPQTAKMARAAELVRARDPELMIEGEIQVDVAVDMALREHSFPWSRLTDTANTFIFPNLAAANITYKMLHQLGGASIFGPILLGMNRPVNILAFNSDASDIVNLAAYTAVRAQDRDAE